MADFKPPGRKGAKTICDPHLTKVLMGQYRLFMKESDPHLLCIVDEQDVRRWWFLIVGLAPPFLNGEYIFTLTASDDFPKKPPRLEFCTDNGVFSPGGPICISIGEFHAEDSPGKNGTHGWRPSLGMTGFAIQVVNGLICHDGLDSGIRILSTDNAVKSAYANKSRLQNQRKFLDIYQQFEAMIAGCPESASVRNVTDARLRAEGKLPPLRMPAAPAAAVAEPVAVPVAAVAEPVAAVAEPVAKSAAAVAEPVAAPAVDEPVAKSAAAVAEPVAAIKSKTDGDMDEYIDSILGH